MLGDDRAGEVLAAKYRLDARLGSGGMGTVYRATNQHVGRQVAIKLLHRELASNEEVVERFVREARAANLVRHPNVVDVLDIGEDDEGTPFIVQELLTGQDLAAFVESQGGTLAIADIEELLLPVIEAVAEAHAQGVIHRDIKPANVFLARQGKRTIAKLLDFGISKVQLPDIAVTKVGLLMGTPAYMSPEQIQGARRADPRSDVWALGIMLFEILAGRVPFDANDAPSLFLAIATTDAPRLEDVVSSIDPKISRVVERCLRRLPDARYPTAAELARDLHLALGGEEPEPTLRRSNVPSRNPAVPDLDLPHAPKLPANLANAPHAGPPSEDDPRAPARRRRSAHDPNEAPISPFDLALELEAPNAPTTTPIEGRRAQVPAASLQAPPSPPELASPAPRHGAGHAFAAPPAHAFEAPSRDPNPFAGPPAHAHTPSASGDTPGVLDGIMMAPGALPARPRGGPPRGPEVAPYQPLPSKPPATEEMTWLSGLGVVGGVALATSAVAMTVVHVPGGVSVARLVVKQESAAIGLQIGLGLVVLIVAWRVAAAAMAKWQTGFARSSAIVRAIAAGLVFSAAIELFRGAW